MYIDNKIVFLIVLIIGLYFNTGVDAYGVTLVVNINKNYNYKKGEECGTISKYTCNSINDAISYFKNKTIFDVNIDGSYEPLSILLHDGIYGFSENLVNFYQLNLQLSPFIKDSRNVIFDGLNQTYEISLFSSLDENENDKVESSLSIRNIKFINFRDTSLLIVSTKISIAYILFDNCYFSNFNSLESNLIRINSDNKFYVKTNRIGVLEISNSVIENMNIALNYSNMAEVLPLIYCEFTTIAISNLIVSKAIARSIIHSSNGYVEVSFSNFIDSQTFDSIIDSEDSNTIIYKSLFKYNLLNETGGVVKMTVSEIGKFNLILEYSQFVYNSDEGLQGGVLFFENTKGKNETKESVISNCQFNFNNSTNSIYAINALLSISGSNFTDNAFMLINSSVTVSNSSINIVDRNLYAKDSSVNFIDCSFHNSSSIPKDENHFSCFSSNIKFSNCTNVNP